MQGIYASKIIFKGFQITQSKSTLGWHVMFIVSQNQPKRPNQLPTETNTIHLSKSLFKKAFHVKANDSLLQELSSRYCTSGDIIRIDSGNKIVYT